MLDPSVREFQLTVVFTMVGGHFWSGVRSLPSCELGHSPNPGLHRVLHLSGHTPSQWRSGPRCPRDLSSRSPSASGFCTRQKRLLVQSVGQGQSHALVTLVGAPEPSLHHSSRRPRADASRDEDGLKRTKKRQKLNKAQGVGATSGTTGTTSTAPRPTRGTKASAAAPPRTTTGRAVPTAPPKGQWNSSTCDSAESAPTFDKGKSIAKGKGKISDNAGKGKSKSKFLGPRHAWPWLC